MENYTTHFLKVIIKIFQYSRYFLDLNVIKGMIDRLVTEEETRNVTEKKLVVMTNSLPLYFVISMFFSTQQVNQIADHESNSDLKGTITQIFSLI